MTDSWVPDACTLPTADQPLRVGEFQQFFAASVTAVERVGPTVLRLELGAPDPVVAGRAAELICAETQCCSFFTFTLRVTGEKLSLQIEVPAGQSAVLDGLARQASVAPNA